MSGEFRSQPSPELGRLLHALGEEPLAPVSDERAVARETRIVERIEAEIAELTRARRIARRGYLALAAAALALLGAGAVVLRRPAPALVIQREPLPSAPARTPKLEASRTAATALPVDPPRRRRVEPPRVEAKPESIPTPPPAAPPLEAANSTLARENQLFREAAEAARGGDLERALAGFDQLVRDHSTSPLAQTALVRRFRLLAKAGRTDQARGDARRYLEAFPNGFAAGEARALLTGSSLDAGAAREAAP
ncbi:MAG TPA: hypothetical protein VG937_26920 [Polyangiaceae bacterium]|nr:hypothetical protein [Polyangiaceae bacterium]